MAGTKVQGFLAALKEMNKMVKSDYTSGKPWHYTNSKKRYKTFKKARASNRLTNCVDAVQFGLRSIGIPASALDWYGSNGKIVWCSQNAQANAKKYFTIKKIGNKTVNQLVNSGTLQPGDIVMYNTMAHTNVYYGSGKSFDAGASQGATFKKWIKSLKWGTSKVSYIMRLKETQNIVYRVRLGIYSVEANAQAKIQSMLAINYGAFTEQQADGWHVYSGSYSLKSKAEEQVSILAKIHIPAVIETKAV